MVIEYNSLFKGWVVITPEQKEELIKHHRNGITALSGLKKDLYIAGRFRHKKRWDIISHLVKGVCRERTLNPTGKL